MTPIAIIQGTPTWVWVLLAFLLYRGIKAMQASTTPLSKLAIVPVIFAGMGIAHLVASPLTGWMAVAVWIITFGAGMIGGVFAASQSRFIVDPMARTVMLPGSKLPLLLIAATFIAKFWLGFEMATVSHLPALMTYTVIDAAVSGIVAGIFAGRFFTYWKTMHALRASWA
ncbi:hypothetical protein AWB76_01041 [Caballeronia temeraria]|uniref:DUF1453 domain-containing protein n=1 Tax=Caballeronia temeraria TaxID=1777137 RepID=A0A157ZPX4_9BURK|nr:DUF6622 family protein [Caballeronia temeraria]SAK47552.1 hypothetical protein AWB76_01041 [Caballeronia temeraria]